MAALSSSSAASSGAPPPPVEFTQEELECMSKVKAQLVAGGLDEARISPRELALTTLNSKLRVDDACEKYIAWLDAIQGNSTYHTSTYRFYTWTCAWQAHNPTIDHLRYPTVPTSHHLGHRITSLYSSLWSQLI
mmetsp:Transcript_8045/g.16991  ORF Transcript_8045/g.16991 Transcript_8045/m.16991 type:complete len:134 (-) Transcript_8045:973-1374(-)